MKQPNNLELWEEDDSEIYKAACAGVPGMRDFEIPKLCLETKNAIKLAQATKGLRVATWALTLFAAAQVVVALLDFISR